MAIPDECVATFPIAGGIFGVGRLATKLNNILDKGQIGPWHVGHWIDFRHTAIRIKFLAIADRKVVCSYIDEVEPSFPTAGPRS